MNFETYKTSKALSPTNGDIRDGIAAELDEQAGQDKMTIDKFFRVSNNVYVFKDKDVKDFRIDCNVANDKTGYAAEVTVFYLQLQKGASTFANVIYPNSTAITLKNLIDGINMSLKERMGVRILL